MPDKLFTRQDLINYVADVFRSLDYDVGTLKKSGRYNLLLYKGGEIFVVKINEKYKLKPSGTINERTTRHLLFDYRNLLTDDFRSLARDRDKEPKIKKILVLTNNQVFNEVAELLKTNFLKNEQEKTDVKVMLIRFPIFKNNFAKNCSNELFSIPQLIIAIKSGVVKLKNLPEDKRDFIIEEMKKHGYKLNPELDWSSLRKGRK